MRLSATLILALSIGSPLASETILFGTTKILHSGGQPLSDVLISSPHADSTLSNAAGEFKLRFPEKKPGETFLLSFRHKEYEIVNLHRASASVGPLEILFAPNGTVRRARKRFLELFTERTRHRRNEALAKAKDWKDTVDAIERYDTALSVLTDASDRLARENLDNAPPEYRASYALLEGEEFAEALLTLENAKGDHKIRLLRARLYLADLNLGSARLQYQKAAESDDFEAVFEAAAFLHEEGLVSDAETAYKKALKLAASESRRAHVLLGLGILYESENRVRDAGAAWKSAHEAYEKLSRIDPQQRPGLARTLVRIGLLNYDMGRHRHAEAALRAALSEYRKLDSPDHKAEVADLLNNLATVESRRDEAVKLYNESLEISRTLAERDPERHLPDVAETLASLAFLSDDPESLLTESLQIRRELADEQPGRFLIHLAAGYNELGAMHSEQRDYTKAMADFGKTLEIYRRLREEFSVPPERLELEEARTRLGIALSCLLSNMQKPDEDVRKTGLQAAKKAEALLQEHPKNRLARERLSLARAAVSALSE